MTAETPSFIQTKIANIDNFIVSGINTREHLRSRIELLQSLPGISQDLYATKAPMLYRDIEANAIAQDKRDRQINTAIVLMERKQARLQQEEAIFDNAEDFINLFQDLDREYEELTELYRNKNTDRFSLQTRVDNFWKIHDETFLAFAEKVKEWVAVNPRIAKRLVDSGILSAEEVVNIIEEINKTQEVSVPEIVDSEPIGNAQAVEVKANRTKVKKPLFELLLKTNRDRTVTLDELTDAIYGESGSPEQKIKRMRSLYQIMYTMTTSLPQGFRIANAETTGRQGRYYLEQLATQEELELEANFQDPTTEVQYGPNESIVYQADIEVTGDANAHDQLEIDTRLFADLTVKDLMFIAIRLQQSTRVGWYNKVLGSEYSEKVLQAGILKNLENLVQYEGGFTPVVQSDQEKDAFMKRNAVRILQTIRNVVSSDQYDQHFYDFTQNKDVNQFLFEMYNIYNKTLVCYGETVDGIEFLIQSFENPTIVDRDQDQYKIVEQHRADNVRTETVFDEIVVEQQTKETNDFSNGYKLPIDYYNETEALGDEDQKYKDAIVVDVTKYLNWVIKNEVNPFIDVDKLMRLVEKSGLPELSAQDILFLINNKTIQFLDQVGERIILDIPTAAVVMYWKQRGSFGTKAVRALHEWIRNYHGIK